MTDGLTNIMLVTDEGALIAAARSEEVDHTVSAVLASIYNEYKVAEQDADPNTPAVLQSIVFDCSAARVACTTFVFCAEETQVLLCVCGSPSTQYGALWSKVELLKNSLKCLEPILSHMAGLTAR
eukprot:CAMPEP_0170574634 /NCGR_PEP_ID=MMETSP0224-20130122/3409_1 /TAXON_ID=285029 /ORGANISM="Togula jolla, Strain CCCM 725" /LENGTH=124 /DNA_ID=CAMNT_0010897313 /DNA_START=9 /DNA_END=383 /DNA_ORIENTATION=+